MHCMHVSSSGSLVLLWREALNRVGMATPEELRAKLLAQRAAQQASQKLQVELQEKAKKAVRSMILLGYNFDDIQDMTNNKVAPTTLMRIYRSLRCLRKRKTKADLEREIFGAHRWKEDKYNYIIVESESESDSESEGKDESDSSFKANTSNDMINNDAPEHPNLNTESQAASGGDDAILDYLVNNISDSQQYHQQYEQDEDAKMDIESHSLPSGTGRDNRDASADPHGIEPETSELEHAERAEGSPSTHPDANEHHKGVDSPGLNIAGKEVAGVPLSDSIGEMAAPVSIQAIEDEVMRSAKDTPKSQQEINDEIERVKLQIKEMERLKITRESNRVAEMEANRLSMELRDIAIKRALLQESREQQVATIDSSSAKIAKLKKSLLQQESELSVAKQELQSLAAQDEELQDAELHLRQNLGRPKIVLPSTNEEQEVNGVSGSEIGELDRTQEERVEEDVKKTPKIHVLSVADSPLRCFSSFRMSPSFGPSMWFSNSFNGRFVKDVGSRTLCPTMLKSNNSVCSQDDCPYIHFSDFDVDPKRVCEYMASRHINDPQYLEGLHQQVSSNLKGDVASAAQIAAVIVGYNRMQKPMEVLDWGTWGLEKDT